LLEIGFLQKDCTSLGLGALLFPLAPKEVGLGGLVTATQSASSSHTSCVEQEDKKQIEKDPGASLGGESATRETGQKQWMIF